MVGSYVMISISGILSQENGMPIHVLIESMTLIALYTRQCLLPDTNAASTAYAADAAHFIWRQRSTQLLFLSRRWLGLRRGCGFRWRGSRFGRRFLEEMVIGHLLVHHDLLPPRHDACCPLLLRLQDLDEEGVVLRLLLDHRVPGLHLGLENRLGRLDDLNSLLGLHLYEVR